MTDKEIDLLLSWAVAEIIDKDKLIFELKTGKILRIKHGIDPTTPDLHLGHSVVYHKLRSFQELGHKIIILMGDFTARFGDPTGKLTARTFRTKTEVRKQSSRYKKQLGKILELKKIEFRYNSEWYDKMALDEFLRIIGNFTIHQMLERNMFQERIKNKKPILIPELIYPILQGYDSVMLKADIAVVGQDQLFNEIQARTLQPLYGQKPQSILATPLLIGLDGKQKMSQSLKNYIGITENADEMYGKTMSIPDALISHYFRLATKLPDEKIAKIENGVETKTLNPMEAKKLLAYEIVKTLHGENRARKAEKFFRETFQKKQLPSELKPLKIKKSSFLFEIIAEQKIFSKSELRRLFKQRAVEFNESVVSDINFAVNVSGVAKIGKKRFFRLEIF